MNNRLGGSQVAAGEGMTAMSKVLAMQTTGLIFTVVPLRIYST